MARRKVLEWPQILLVVSGSISIGLNLPDVLSGNGGWSSWMIVLGGIVIVALALLQIRARVQFAVQEPAYFTEQLPRDTSVFATLMIFIIAFIGLTLLVFTFVATIDVSDPKLKQVAIAFELLGVTMFVVSFFVYYRLRRRYAVRVAAARREAGD